MATEIRNPWCLLLANLADSNSKISTVSRRTFYANEKLPGICIGKQQVNVGEMVSLRSSFTLSCAKCHSKHNSHAKCFAYDGLSEENLK